MREILVSLSLERGDERERERKREREKRKKKNSFHGQLCLGMC